MPTFGAIRNGAVEAAKIDLAPYLEHIADQVQMKVRHFVQGKAPELRPMLRYLHKFVHEIPADLLQPGAVIEATLPGRGKDGLPACATVRPLGPWRPVG